MKYNIMLLGDEIMRLDKFLKDSRLVKRRTVAKQMCDANKVQIDGKTAKASSEVMIDNVITIEYAKMFFTIKVLSLEISLAKATAYECYQELARENKTI